MTRPTSLHELMTLNATDLAAQDIALVNLLCASGLRGAERLDVNACVAKLDDWAADVQCETERNMRLFTPKTARDTVGFLRCWTLCKVLRHKKGLRHHLQLDNIDPKVTWTSLGSTKPDERSCYFDAEPIFLHGLLGQRAVGSCTSFPVLYAAVGRRLGYPIKLVLSVSHVFIRWEDPNDCFNMDPGPNYINVHPDEYYIDKPMTWTPAERSSGNWFRSLSAEEELGLFIGLRAPALEANGRLDEALDACNIAQRYLPRDPLYPTLARRIQTAKYRNAKRLLWQGASSPTPGVTVYTFPLRRVGCEGRARLGPSGTSATHFGL